MRSFKVQATSGPQAMWTRAVGADQVQKLPMHRPTASTVVKHVVASSQLLPDRR